MGVCGGWEISRCLRTSRHAPLSKRMFTKQHEIWLIKLVNKSEGAAPNYCFSPGNKNVFRSVSNQHVPLPPAPRTSPCWMRFMESQVVVLAVTTSFLESRDAHSSLLEQRSPRESEWSWKHYSFFSYRLRFSATTPWAGITLHYCCRCRCWLVSCDVTEREAVAVTITSIVSSRRKHQQQSRRQGQGGVLEERCCGSKKEGERGKEEIKKVSETRVEEAKAKMSDSGREAEADERPRNLRTNIIFKHTIDKQIL